MHLVSGNAGQRRSLQTLGRRPSVILEEAVGEGSFTSVDRPAPISDVEVAVESIVEPLVSSPTASSGVFAGLVLGLAGWQSGDGEEKKLIELICSSGGKAVHGTGNSLQSLLKAKLDVCVCRGSQSGLCLPDQPQLALATPHWIHACVADNVMHARSAYPHFEPSKAQLPLACMSGCMVRITALEKFGHRQRARLEELVQVLGAKVAQESSRITEITQVVCVVPEFLDSRLAERARKRQIPLVSVQWLFDCFRMSGRQSEEKYAVSEGSAVNSAEQSAAATQSGNSFAVTVLANTEILISPAALGSLPKLPQMAEELGAVVQTWRSVEELLQMLQTCDSAGTVVLVEKEEVSRGQLDSCVVALAPESRGIFVQPSWLSEMYSQRRRLPLESFSALPSADAESDLAPKRPRISAEASYAWQPAEMKRLEEVSEQARALEMQSKAQQKVNEGLRLVAELRREPSRS
eukprot:gb/GFBE01037647.1/.p1 GENE.gb/GFBE01037647.1/~~gb/GFBE01037647.1/.p1  ORF type:complete len:464 (+),score=101.22 gb/GFBE01037647.1/:1-1392(+)